VPFLKQQGVKKLDYVVISHPHGDHIAGLLEVFRQIPVGTLIDPALEHDEPEYAELLGLAKRKNADYQVVGEGDALDWDPALKIDVFGPPRDFAYEHLNDNSVALRIVHGEVAFLFSGDAESESENRLARRYKGALRAHVLKAGHHGSKTSSTPRFLDAVKPETVVISCGRGNLFRHPHQITLSRLNARGVHLYRTDLDGDVTVRSDGVFYTVEPQYE
jgi:competence protein ComEC